MEFRHLAFDSAEYRDACALRNKVLRKPLGLELLEKDLAGEANQLHYGLYAWADVTQPTLVACVIAAPEVGQRIRLRQMAVDPQVQGQGRGRELITEVEQDLTQRGFREIYFHARVPAVGFYQKLGYATVGEEFSELGIAHVQMHKQLRQPVTPTDQT